MDRITLVFFQILDLAVIIGCPLSVIHGIPGDIDSQKWKKILAWTGYGALALLMPVLGNDLLTVLSMTVWYVLTGYVLYFHSKMGIVYQVVYHVFLMAAQYMALYLTAIFLEIFQVEYPLNFYLYAAMRCALLILLTVILRMIIHRRFQDAPYLKIRGMVIVPIFSMILIVLFVLAGDIFFVRYGYHWLLVYVVLMVILNLYCLYFWYDVAKNKELKHRLELMEQQKDLTVQYYMELEKNYEQSRKVIHDIRNHLHAIEQKYKIEDREYMDDMHDMLNSMGMKFYTENHMLNIVLNDRLGGLPPQQADCNLDGIGLEFLTDMDITTIFANILENAVEAGRGREDFWVKIRGKEIQDFTIVKISNPLYVPYVEGRSAKAGHEGIGLQNVRQAVDKYHGQMRIRAENGVFSVTLLFAKQNEA